MANALKWLIGKSAPAVYSLDRRHRILRRAVKVAERRCLFWWEPEDGRDNIGDYLSRVVVSHLLATRDLELTEKLDVSRPLFSIGSVLHFAQTGDVVWGSGINGHIPAAKHRFAALDVRAIRGPLTRKFLMEQKGIDAPEVFGDPALLTPLLLPRSLLVSEELVASKDFVVIPHFSESLDRYAKVRDKIVSPICRPAEFIRQILQAKLVISSSLHGVILAEAYGIPSVFLNWGNVEPAFKYDDYYLGTGRSQYHFGHDIEECLALGGNANFDLATIQQGLVGAFPYDLWSR